MEESCTKHPDHPLVVNCGTFKIGSHSIQKWINLEHEITMLFDKFKPQSVIIERNFYYKSVTTTASLNQLCGVIKLLVALRSIELDFIDNNTTKVHMLGSTKYWNGNKYVSVTKDMMHNAVVKNLCSDSKVPSDHDASDAIAIGYTFYDSDVQKIPLSRRPVVIKS